MGKTLSWLKAITVELRGALPLILGDETMFEQTLILLDSASPTPVWRRSGEGLLRYYCPIARIVAAKLQMESLSLAHDWHAALVANRNIQRMNPSSVQQLNHPAQLENADFIETGFLAATAIQREGDLLVWTADEPGLQTWLADTMSMAEWKARLQSGGLNLSRLADYGRQRTAEREFDWQLSYANSHQILEVLKKGLARENLPARQAFPAHHVASGQLSKTNSLVVWNRLLPIVQAQMAVVDAIALAPQQLPTAVDQLCLAWRNEVMNYSLSDLYLGQMAYAVPIADVVRRSRDLLGLSLRLVFGQWPIEQL